MQSVSKAWNYVKNNKWKVMGAATTATVGFLWWRGRSARSDWAQLQNKQTFWTDSQSTCDQTIVSFAPLVAKTLNEITKIPEMLEQLRKPDLDRQTKLELWEQLKVASFAYMVASVYSMSMLSAYLRVAVNVISRYLYKSKQQQSHSLTSLLFSFLFRSSSSKEEQIALKELSALSAETQREYLKLTDHFLRRGLPKLVETTLELAKPELESWSLKKECSFEDTRLMLSTVHARLQKIIRTGPGYPEDDISLSIPGFLLPTEAERANLGRGDPIAAQLAALSAIAEEDEFFESDLDDTDKLKLLINETRNIVESTPFDLVVESCVRVGFHTAFEELRKTFSEAGDSTASQKFLLAKLIPLINKHSSSLLQAPDNQLVRLFAQSPDLNDFSHRVFDDRVFDGARGLM